MMFHNTEMGVAQKGFIPVPIGAGISVLTTCIHNDLGG